MVRGCALGKPQGLLPSRHSLGGDRHGPRHACLPSSTGYPFYFFVFSKRASPDSLPGVIDAGGGSFSQSLAFDLASRGGAAVAAVSGTPSGAARACADFAARSRARFCKHQEPLPSLTTGNVSARLPHKPLTKH